ncbi:MYXO-CTERM sorting domain-containing protein [Nannocystis sp.]|uniref:MYXO-CTERM sorting domain-containing protein n=1 Tax=Nannocystis sp. TaxID=1962667 RepID=UPI0025FA1AAB|nr:MYXO-CTERM sorting domain-containing protein [Nannocystis sp.]
MRFARNPILLGSHALGLAALLLSDTATAFAPRPASVGGPAVHGLERADHGRVRTQRAVAWNQTPAHALRPHAALAAAIAATDTIWDSDSDVPLRIWGAGTPAPGSVADPAIAARHARELLSQHLALLAPGSRVDDFILASNDLSAGVRSVGFRQQHRGRPVLGGQLSFRFKADRLVMIGSEALPRVAAALTDAPVDPATARARALAWVRADAAASATVTAVDGPFILPLIAGRHRSDREVLRVQVAAERPLGRFDVYVDAATGEPVAREQTLRFATGTLKFDVPKRGPQGERADLPAPRLKIFIADVPGVTDADGVLTIADGMDAVVATGVLGELVSISNQAGMNTKTDLVLEPGGVAVWSAAKDELQDAQLASYIHAARVKEYVRGIAPDFAYLDQNLAVRVNINDVCNAFSEGDAINFFAAGMGCENTGRIADIVYHEFGHSVHQQGLIPGVGAFEGALSEGISDYLSATITDDSGLGRGFFVDAPSGPLRELNPQGQEARWPEDIEPDPHATGLIIAGTLWDLRADLRDKLGPAEGTALTDKIWFESIRRAVDIPSMYPEALVVDDDDGDLSNGTPNECEINRAFYAHGLLGPADIGATVTLAAATPAGIPVTLAIGGQPKACVDLVPTSAVLRWRLFGNPDVKEVAMDLADQKFTALLPTAAADTVTEYQVVAELSDATTVSFPINLADPWYQLYQGEVTPLYCSGFEGPADGDGWEIKGGFEQGPPGGQGGDPKAAYAGSEVFGINLAGTYKPKSSSTLTSPPIKTQGFKKVRLQYRRWLGVEDAHFDQATILVNGLAAWRNLDSNMGDASNMQHRDLEWRFHDIDITPGIVDGAVQVAYQLRSDEGLELAGWNVDEFCVVGVNPLAQSSCGDGKQDPGEACDDGNQQPGDGCDATCNSEGEDPPTTGEPTSGASDSSSGEVGDDGDGGQLDDDGCSCRSDDDAPPIAALGLGLLVLAFRRRPRATSRA